MSTSTAESGWCPYCQKLTVQDTTLVDKEAKKVYETRCSKCNHLLRWHLVSIKKED